jgi:hypothetical protein
MLSRDGYECGKRYSDQHSSTLGASEMLLSGGNERSKLSGKCVTSRGLLTDNVISRLL